MPTPARLLSDEHFTVDGTLLEAWASHKSFRPRDEDAAADRRRQSDGRIFTASAARTTTHQSTTDPDARLYKKARGREARLGYLGHVADGASLGPDREGHGHAGRRPRRTRRGAGDDRSACPGAHRITVAADKGYDTRDFVAELRAMDVTPHVAQHTAGRRSAIDARTTRHAGLRGQSTEAEARRARLRLDEDRSAGLRKLRHRGGPLVTWIFTFTAAAYNIVRLRRLLPATA